MPYWASAYEHVMKDHATVARLGGKKWQPSLEAFDFAEMTSYFSSAAVLLALSGAAVAAPASAAVGTNVFKREPVQCNGTFEDISAADYIKAVNPGWNLGNTLDAIPNEGSWNNPPVVAATFDAVKAAGFRSVRIPVTYTHHFLSEAPDYQVDPAWLQRVDDVINMALERDLYVVTNVHHDSWEWADVSKEGADIAAINDKFEKLWIQVATKLACKSSLVAFESINEPPATTAEHGAAINELNAIFLKTLEATGGFNTKRVVTLSGGNQDSTKTSQWFKPPAEIANPWALQFHYYSPYDFSFSAWGKTTWGSDADKAAVEAEMGLVRGNFSDVPLYIGEFNTPPFHTENAARWRWFDHVIKTANDIGAAVVVWDNGLDHLDREAASWRDPTNLDVLLNAVKGTSNSLPDSTVDGAATEQSSSAYIFNRVGNAVENYELPWLFNGNTLTKVTLDGKDLTADTDYTVAASSITFTASFLSPLLSADATPGSKGQLTLSFSAGADIAVEIVQWDVPTLSQTSSKAVGGADLPLPVKWNGLPKLATVKILQEDGTYLVDDWTNVLGPLQQARGTYDGQWKFEGDDVIIKAAAVDLVVANGKAATFTFEFYPRVEGNSVEYTLNP
ncbi:Endoglucanase B [Paramyrothecium foliicola]|nr:Endoglucanase B [Paramyrothecium foliicola]